MARPGTIEEVAWVVAQADAVLPVGAQSSLTGGATPAGDVVLSTERLTSLDVRDTHVRAGAGVTLRVLQEALHPRGLWFPAAPTFLGATVGGAVSTNAAGPATFKDGSATEQAIQPAGKWPKPLAAHPPLRFIARQTLAVVRGLRRELGLEAERVRIEPPPGTTDERGREVKGAIVLAIVRR